VSKQKGIKMAEHNAAERKRPRSPGYPTFALPEAIRKAEQLYRHDKRNPVPLSVAAEHWGYSPTSSAVLLSIATLKKFGLLEEVGGGASRQVRLTDLALHLLLSSEGSADREQAVKVAAMRPALHAELWEQYGEDLPSDPNLKKILIMEKGFGDGPANDVIREYKETISFAKVKRESNMGRREGDVQASSEADRMLTPSNSPASSGPGVGSGKASQLREYRFPLIDTTDAELRLPSPMTEENFQLLKEQLDLFMKITRKALVAQDRNQGEAT
jgi:hypothetical protein